MGRQRGGAVGTGRARAAARSRCAPACQCRPRRAGRSAPPDTAPSARQCACAPLSARAYQAWVAALAASSCAVVALCAPSQAAPPAQSASGKPAHTPPRTRRGGVAGGVVAAALAAATAPAAGAGVSGQRERVTRRRCEATLWAHGCGAHRRQNLRRICVPTHDTLVVHDVVRLRDRAARSTRETAAVRACQGRGAASGPPEKNEAGGGAGGPLGGGRAESRTRARASRRLQRTSPRARGISGASPQQSAAGWHACTALRTRAGSARQAEVGLAGQGVCAGRQLTSLGGHGFFLKSARARGALR